MANQNIANEAFRRIAVLDIETVALDPADPKGALRAATGRIVCINLLFDDGARISETSIIDPDERRLLERFWASLLPADLIVGHNVLNFDLLFIRQRSIIQRVKPPIALNLRKYYTDQVVDVMQVWTNWGAFKDCGLDDLAEVLELGHKTSHGSEVAAMWAARDFDRLSSYCREDVRLAYGVYCRMMFREPLPFPGVAQAATVQPAVAARPAAPVAAPVAVPVAAAPAQASGWPNADDLAAAVEAAKAARRPSRSRSSRPAQPAQGGMRESGGGGPRSTWRRREGEVIAYQQAGQTVILTGTTFPIKDALRQLGGRPYKSGDSWLWEAPAAAFAELRSLCDHAGIGLVNADPRRAA